MRDTFNDAAGKNLNWFWNNWFFTNHYLDIAVGAVKIAGHDLTVDVRNVGGFAIPFDVELQYSDGTSKSFHQTPAVWSADQQLAAITVLADAGKTIAALELKTGLFVDADPSDNKWLPK